MREPRKHGHIESGTILAFDFGAKRVGVAVGDLERGIAHPLDTIAFEDNRRRMGAIATLVTEWQPVRFIVGAPGGIHQNDHPMSAPIGRFIRRLQARFGIEVETIDEALSSWAASRKLSQSGVPAKFQKRMVDSIAACVILETWLETKRPGVTLPTNQR